MIARHICIPHARWCVDIFYDARPHEARYIVDRLWDMGCPDKYLFKAERLLKSGRPNEGLTYSNPRLRHSIIVIGHATNPFEILNSCSHELDHLQQAICKADGIEPDGEDAAYLMGDLTEALARDAWMAVRKLFLYLT